MEGYESLEEGEIPSPPPAVVVERGYGKQREINRNSLRTYRPPRKKRKCRTARKNHEIADFDRMRTKCLERLKQKNLLEREIASKEMEATEIDDVEMEDANVIILGDSEEEELKKLRDVALSSQRNTNRTSDEEDKEKTENEFLLRAEALKTAILKKRSSIIRKKNKLNNNRKHLLQNDSVENVKANINKTEDSCNDRVDIDIKTGKENLDNSEINDEEALREQLLASIKTSNKAKSFLVDNLTAEQTNLNGVTKEAEVKETISESNTVTIPVATISPIKFESNDSKKYVEIRANQQTQIMPIKNNLDADKNTLLLARHDDVAKRKALFVERNSSSQIQPLINSKDVLAANNNLSIIKSKMLKPKLISKNFKNVPKSNGLVVKKKSKDIKKLPITMLVPKTIEQRIVVNIGPDSSDDDVEEPKKLPEPGNLMNSIDDFLSKARQLTETTNSTSIPSTPEAVYAHLPPSQRMEYIKLKKKLAEKEESLKLKKIESKQPNEPEPSPSTTQTLANISKLPSQVVKTNATSKLKTLNKSENITSLPQQISKTLSNSHNQQSASKILANEQIATTEIVANSSVVKQLITAATVASSQLITAKRTSNISKSYQIVKTNATNVTSKLQTLSKVENITSLPQQVSVKTVSNSSVQQIETNEPKANAKVVANSPIVNKQITAASASSSQQIISKRVANVDSSAKGNQRLIEKDLIIANNKIVDKVSIANNVMQSTNNKSLNRVKHVKTKTKRDIELSLNDTNLAEKNNLSVFLKKNIAKPLVPTTKSKNAQQNFLKVNSNITNATQLMHLLKKELILEKNANSELARLKLQVNCAEQKKKVHSTRVSLLRSRIKHLLESSKVPPPQKSDSPKNKEENNKRETSDVTISDIKLVNSTKVDSTVPNTKKDENNIRDDVPLLKKRKTQGSFEDYESPLSKTESDINPLVEFCPHDLTGKCRDPDCQYQHLPSKTVK